MTNWTVNPIYPYWILLTAAALLLAALWLGPTFGNLSPRKKWILKLLRALSFAFLLICFLRPGLITTERKPQTAVLNLLIDISRSMELAHDASGSSRYEVLQNILQKNQAQLQELKEENIELKVYGYDREIVPLELQNGRITLPEKPDGGQTDLAFSLFQSFKGIRSKRPVGTILMGDGVENVGSEPEILLPQALKPFSDLQIPLFTVAFGQQGDAGQFADLAITNMREQFAVNIKNELIVNATLKTRGFVNREIPVRLVVYDAAGQAKTVQTLRKTVTQQEQEIELAFSYIPQVAGQFTLSVEAERQPQELVTKNNSLPAFLNVDEKGLRVLYVRGKEGIEQLYLKKAIDAAQGIDVDVEYIHPDTRSRWPVDRNELFANTLYDVYIFHDIDASAFFRKGDDRSSLETLVSQIEKGKGFMMIGGNHSFGAGGYYDTPLGKILPIEMDAFERQSFGSVTRRNDLHVPGPIKLKPARSHFLTSLFAEENEKNWKELPPLSSVNRFKGLKNQARILLESTDSDPVLIQGNYGGRLLLFAGDSTWKWWTSGKKEIHKRFWRQVIFWLAKRDGLGNDNIRINLPQRRFSPESEIRFTCEASSTLGEPIEGATFTGELTNPEGTSNPVSISTLDAEAVGQIDPEFLTLPGKYSLTVFGKEQQRELGSTRVEFVVIDRDSEKANPVANPGRLLRMSKQTSEWGGRAVPPSEFGDLISEIIENREDQEVEVQTKWQLGDTWQDGLLVVLCFAAFFGVEWTLRKKWGLV